MRVRLDEDEEQHQEDFIPAVPAEGTLTLRFVHRVSIAEQRNSGNGAVDADKLEYPCSVVLMVSGGEAKW